MRKPAFRQTNTVTALGVCYLLTGCANPQGNAYDDALAAVEREEQRLLMLSSDNTDSVFQNPGAINDVSSASAVTFDSTDRKTTAIVPIAPDITSYPGDGASTPSWWSTSVDNSLRHTQQCLIVSKPLSLNQGGKNINLQFVLTDNTIYLRTDSPRKLDTNPVSLRVDDNPPVAFDQRVNKSVTAIFSNYLDILDQIQTGNYVSIDIVFNSENGVPNLRLTELSLDGFLQAYSNLKNC